MRRLLSSLFHSCDMFLRIRFLFICFNVYTFNCGKTALLCWFLPCSDMNQPQVYVCSFPLEPPTPFYFLNLVGCAGSSLHWADLGVQVESQCPEPEMEPGSPTLGLQSYPLDSQKKFPTLVIFLIGSMTTSLELP